MRMGPTPCSMPAPAASPAVTTPATTTQGATTGTSSTPSQATAASSTSPPTTTQGAQPVQQTGSPPATAPTASSKADPPAGPPGVHGNVPQPRSASLCCARTRTSRSSSPRRRSTTSHRLAEFGARAAGPVRASALTGGDIAGRTLSTTARGATDRTDRRTQGRTEVHVRGRTSIQRIFQQLEQKEAVRGRRSAVCSLLWLCAPSSRPPPRSLSSRGQLVGSHVHVTCSSGAPPSRPPPRSLSLSLPPPRGLQGHVRTFVRHVLLPPAPPPRSLSSPLRVVRAAVRCHVRHVHLPPALPRLSLFSLVRATGSPAGQGEGSSGWGFCAYARSCRA